ncbi:MAG: ABC transporter permease subunit [Candidatus Aminicenantes bacterium]|nr:ABC transporter permease subunit [Candidatus Aminicenantes bacterium]
MGFGSAFRKEWLEQRRTYRLLIVAVVLLLFGLMSPLLARYTPEIIRMAAPQGEEIIKLLPPPTAGDAVDQYLKNITQFGVLLALFMTMGTMSLEKDRGTAALMLSKPLPRSAFVLGKFASLALTFTLSLLLAGAAGFYYTWLLFGPPDPAGWLGLNVLVLIFLLVYVALTLLCSTMTKSQVLAGGMSFGLWLTLSLLGAFPRIGDYLPRQLTDWAARLGKGTGVDSIGNLSPLIDGRSGTYWPALAVSLGLIAASLLVSCLIFKRQEL